MDEIVSPPERSLLLRIVDRLAEVTLYASIAILTAAAMSNCLGG